MVRQATPILTLSFSADRECLRSTFQEVGIVDEREGWRRGMRKWRFRPSGKPYKAMDQI